LWEAVLKHLTREGTGFHTPGHQGGKGIDPGLTDFWGMSVLRSDLTELPGLDNLYLPRGVIREAQQLMAEVHDAEASCFLVNGTTAGILAMLLAVGGPGKAVVVPRNCHLSVIHGLILSGSIPVFAYPEVDKPTGIPLGISLSTLQTVLEDNPATSAVFLLNPNYFGICGPLQEQVELCHHLGKVVLVDEAHGSHFTFHPRLPLPAMKAGADICAQSYHKTLTSLTQSSVLHWRNTSVAEERIQKAVTMVQSTSPSYLLLASLDIARRQMALHGYHLWEKALDRASRLRKKINGIEGFWCLNKEDITGLGFTDLDETRLVITGQDLGLSGQELANILTLTYHIDVEMAQGSYIVLIITPGTEERDCGLLFKALKEIALERKGSKRKKLFTGDLIPPLPLLRLTPREAWFARHRRVTLEQGIGQVAAEVVAACPPGMPVLIPGEEISPEICRFLTGKIETVNIVDG